MEMLKKLQSTVAQAVTQVSGALPGNPVTREYEVKEHIASAGPGEKHGMQGVAVNVFPVNYTCLKYLVGRQTNYN